MPILGLYTCTRKSALSQPGREAHITGICNPDLPEGEQHISAYASLSPW